MLWNLFKHLKDMYPIYINMMDEDEDNIPNNYLILEDDTFDESFVNGDGKNLIRKKNFNIRIFCRGKSVNNDFVDAIRSILLNNSISFKQSGPVYESTDDYSSILITGTYIYES